MNLTKITAVALAVLLVGAGAAAAIPGNAADQAETNADDGASDADAASQADAADENASDEGANASERRGPPEDMPSQVPDHVSQIHETINSWLDGGKEGNLGDMISDIVGGEDEADETEGEETETEDEQTDEQQTEDEDTETSSEDTETSTGDA